MYMYKGCLTSAAAVEVGEYSKEEGGGDCDSVATLS